MSKVIPLSCSMDKFYSCIVCFVGNAYHTKILFLITRSDMDARAAPKLTAVPKTLSSGGAKSPLTPGGAIIRRTEVLKRNCQVLVLDSST